MNLLHRIIFNRFIFSSFISHIVYRFDINIIMNTIELNEYKSTISRIDDGILFQGLLQGLLKGLLKGLPSESWANFYPEVVDVLWGIAGAEAVAHLHSESGQDFCLRCAIILYELGAQASTKRLPNVYQNVYLAVRKWRKNPQKSSTATSQWIVDQNEMNWHEGDQRVIHVAVTLITRNKMARMSLPDFCDEPAWARPPVGAVWHFPRGRWWPPLERRRCSSPQMARRRLRNFPKNPEKSRGIPSNGPDISWQHTWHWRPTPGAGAFEFRHWKTSRPAPLRHWLPARPVANALRCRTDKSTPIWNHCQIPSIPFDIFYPFFHTLLPLNFNVDSFPMNFNANLWLCSIVRIKRAERERCGTERCTWPTAAALLPANCEQLKLQACGLGFMKGAQPPNRPTTQPPSLSPFPSFSLSHRLSLSLSFTADDI